VRVGTKVVRLAVILTLLASASALHAQAVSPDELLAKARQTYTEQGASAALPQFQAALDAYQRAHDRRGEAITLGLLGNCYKRLGDHKKALQLLQQALAMKRELGDRLEEGKTLSHLGLLYWEMGDYPQAIKSLTLSLQLARELQDRQLEGASLNNLSLVYDEQGDYQRSLDQYRRALELHRATGFVRGESDTLGNIGGVYLLLGRYREALPYYEQSLAISERMGWKPAASQDLGNIAFCYVGTGRFTEALTRFDRALQLAHDAGLKKEEAELHKGRGSALLRMGKFNAALEEYAKAVHSYEEAGLKKEQVEGLSDRGSLYLMLGDLVSAEQDFSQAMALAERIGYGRGITTNLLALGDLEARRERHEKAVTLYQQALERSRKQDDRSLTATSLLRLAGSLVLGGNPREARQQAHEALDLSRQNGAAPLEAEALLALADLLHRENNSEAALQQFVAAEKLATDLGDPELQWQAAYGRGRQLEALVRPEEAVAAYRRAVEIIESVQAQLREDRYRSGYLQNKSQVYISLVRLLLRLGRKGDAFLYLEKLRAQVYPDRVVGGLPFDLSDREQELRSRIHKLREALDKENSKGAELRQQAATLFSAELQSAEREYQNLLDDQRSVRRGERATVASLTEVQHRLGPGHALLEYVVTEDAVLIFLLRPQDLKTATVALTPEELETRIELLRDLLTRKDDRWRGPAETLYGSLIAPVEEADGLKGIEKISIVPYGVLHYVPFAALTRRQGPRREFLIEKYVLDYLPSASELASTAAPSEATDNLLALAPSSASLRYASQEVREIGALYPNRARELVGAKATESSFKRIADRYQIIHFATHGFFNKLNPLFSGVQLEADGQEDGRLEVHEILGLHLHARLVTLSACETALGSGYFADLPAGDDFVGLTRAFLMAGSSSVLATLWQVNDRSTLGLMKSFYRRLPRQETANALAQAQREMLAGPARFRHPYYWAAFVLLGQSQETSGKILAEKSRSRP
jgi:CHAT domain-containing protein/tetratricopeptide (TPR) repeat protein